MRSRYLPYAAVVSLAATVACGAPSDETENTDSAVTLDDLDVRVSDSRKLSLTDLSRLTMGALAEGLQKALKGNGWSAPQVYAAQGQPLPILPQKFEVKGLDKIVTGLAQELGETELSTRVNAIRLAHLQSGQDKYFVESEFTGGFKDKEKFTVGAEGFADTAIQLGVDVNTGVTSRVVMATDDGKIGDLAATMGEAAQNLRGFINPASFPDIAKMKPGEAFGFKAFGKLGANLNLISPLLVLDPLTLVFRIVASAGIAGAVEGEIDVEIVKLEGDEFVVDFGVDKARGWTLRAGINDEWGIKGVCERADGSKFRCLDKMRTKSGATIDLQRIAEKAVARQLNKFNVIAVNGEISKEVDRHSIARFHFHPNRGDRVEAEKAFQQAVYNFDIRYAQALAQRDLGQSDAAVENPFDAVRSASTSRRKFGAELFGINLFHKAVVERTVSFSVDTPDGRKAILGDIAHTERSGVFVHDFDFTRTGVAAQTVDKRRPDYFQSEANLIMQGAIGDPHMTDDVIIDSLDATLHAIGGLPVVEALDVFGNEISRLVWTTCPAIETQPSGGPRSSAPATRRVDEQCNVRLLSDPRMTDLKQKGMEAIEPHIAGLSEAYKGLVREAARNRLALQSVGIHEADGRKGPNASYTLDARLDEKALDALMKKSKDQYKATLTTYATLMRGNRTAEDAILDRSVIAREVEKKWSDDIEKMATTFERHSHAYRDVAAVEALLPQALAGLKFVSQPLGVTYDERNRVADIEQPKLTALSQHRSQIVQRMFDDLRREAGGLSRRQAIFFKRHDALSPAHAAAFPLIALAPHDNIQVAFSLRADSNSDFWTGPERYKAAGFKNVDMKAEGRSVSLISAEMFNLDKILGLPSR
jgi:hypothetical protein